MKKLIAMVMMGTLILLSLAVTLHSCDRARDRHWREELVQACLNKETEMHTVQDALFYKIEKQRRAHIDSVFLSLTDKQLTDIVSVLKAYGKTTYKPIDVVIEYESNRHVYDALPKNNIVVQEMEKFRQGDNSSVVTTNNTDTICVQL